MVTTNQLYGWFKINETINQIHQEYTDIVVDIVVDAQNSNMATGTHTDHNHHVHNVHHHIHYHSSGQDHGPDHQPHSHDVIHHSGIEAAAAAVSVEQIASSQWRYPFIWTLVLCFAYSIVFVLGLFGNGAVLWVIYTMRHNNNTQNPMFASCNNVFNYFICNLAVADLLVIIFCLLPNLLGNILTTWILGRFICKAVPYLQGVSVSASIYTLVAISIDRFYGIYYPFNNGFSPLVRRNVIAFIWVLSMTITIPWLFYFDLDIQDDNNIMCREVWPEEWIANLYFLLVNCGLQYLLPVSIIIFFYVLLYMKISKRRVPMFHTSIRSKSSPATNKDGRIASTCSADYETDSGGHSVSVDFNSIENLNIRIMEKSKLKVLKMLIIIVSFFVLSWLPIYIIFCIIKFVPIDEHSFRGKLLIGLTPLAQWLGAANSCVNPILYFFFNRKFRAHLRKTIVQNFCCGFNLISNNNHDSNNQQPNNNRIRNHHNHKSNHRNGHQQHVYDRNSSFALPSNMKDDLNSHSNCSVTFNGYGGGSVNKNHFQVRIIKDHRHDGNLGGRTVPDFKVQLEPPTSDSGTNEEQFKLISIKATLTTKTLMVPSSTPSTFTTNSMSLSSGQNNSNNDDDDDDGDDGTASESTNPKQYSNGQSNKITNHHAEHNDIKDANDAKMVIMALQPQNSGANHIVNDNAIGTKQFGYCFNRLNHRKNNNTKKMLLETKTKNATNSNRNGDRTMVKSHCFLHSVSLSNMIILDRETQV